MGGGPISKWAKLQLGHQLSLFGSNIILVFSFHIILKILITAHLILFTHKLVANKQEEKTWLLCNVVFTLRFRLASFLGPPQWFYFLAGWRENLGTRLDTCTNASSNNEPATLNCWNFYDGAIITWASLITGMEHGMEQWTYTVAANLCNWCCSV